MRFPWRRQKIQIPPPRLEPGSGVVNPDPDLHPLGAAPIGVAGHAPGVMQHGPGPQNTVANSVPVHVDLGPKDGITAMHTPNAGAATPLNLNPHPLPPVHPMPGPGPGDPDMHPMGVATLGGGLPGGPDVIKVPVIHSPGGLPDVPKTPAVPGPVGFPDQPKNPAIHPGMMAPIAPGSTVSGTPMAPNPSFTTGTPGTLTGGGMTDPLSKNHHHGHAEANPFAGLSNDPNTNPKS